ncbi:paralemmin 1a isoform X2 [Engraulis encrasicolus]|uniref:paralemmin 1a isoform X2 n=1 Tax=Engraulis encrasicolus TaxID=184585 RepID=UPI002FD5CEDC
MEMSEALSQQERLQAIAEKRKRETEIENKRRQLEDDRRQLQHLKSKALRERWLLDGVPSGGPEEDAAKKQLQEDEDKLKALEDAITRMEQELEELETGVSATSTKENLTDDAKEDNDNKTADIIVSSSVKEVKVQQKVHHSPRPRMVPSGDGSEMMMRAAMYSVEITVEKDRVTGETKVLSSNTRLPKDLTLHGVKVYEDAQKVVHEVREVDGVPVANGVQQLSSSEVEELILKADEAVMHEGGAADAAGAGDATTTTVVTVAPSSSSVKVSGSAEEGEDGGDLGTKVEITGMEAGGAGGGPEAVGVGDVTAEKPVTMVFMGYQSVEDEAETKKVLGLEGTVKAELVVIGGGGGGDGENKTPPSPVAAAGDGTATSPATESTKEKTPADEQAPPNGSTAEPIKSPEEKEAGAADKETETSGAEITNEKKQPCKCCVIM